MFTGLVEEIGRIAEVRGDARGSRLHVVAPLVRRGLALGDSVAVDGTCLTVVELTDGGFAVDCVAETLRRTALGDRRAGDAVNLERALRAGDRLGGHIVQGHVDGVAIGRAVTPEGDGLVLRVDAPAAIMRYVVEKGSITLDGVSLTVAARDDSGLSVALIPHTISATTLGPEAVGRRMNVEVDVVAKYIEALAAPYVLAQRGGSA